MVWWYITLWPKNTISTNLKVSYTIHKLWSTLVWPTLLKFISNINLLKIYWNLHLWHLCVNDCPWRIINVNKTVFLSTNPLSKLRSMWVDHVRQPQLDTCVPLIHLALFKWPQIWHKGQVTRQLMFSRCPDSLVWNFRKIHAKTQI